MAKHSVCWLRRLTLILGLLSIPNLLVSAHGGGEPQLTNELVGPYLLSAWTNPDPPQVGELHITLALALATTGDALTEPEIRVIATHANGDAISALASHEGALTPFFYEADIAFPKAGLWQIQVTVQGTEGAGNAGFSLDVQEQATNWLLIGVIGVVAIAVLWIIYMLYAGRKEQHTEEKPAP